MKFYKFDDLNSYDEECIKSDDGFIYVLNKIDKTKARFSFMVTEPSHLCLKSEGVELLKKDKEDIDIPEWLSLKIQERKVISINTDYEDWKTMLSSTKPDKWRVNIAGLGDVGGILLSGLRLIGGECISNIGIFDLDINKVRRWEYEAGQIVEAFTEKAFPQVKGVGYNELFDCDIFLFCISIGVPGLTQKAVDVRMAQLEGNAKVIKQYAKLAADVGFKGIFAVVSDPVDPLCKAALEGGQGRLLPEQIRGYGLGVMNARAIYFSSQDDRTKHYISEGRAFGPHGEGLIIADSIENYNQELSDYLTDKTKRANLEIRSLGYKPYIAPAFSSGVLSIIATLKGTWHYSSTFMGGVYMGSKNRLNGIITELETLDIKPELFLKLKSTYESLANINE